MTKPTGQYLNCLTRDTLQMMSDGAAIVVFFLQNLVRCLFLVCRGRQAGIFLVKLAE
jgi:hypothetical protein